MTLTVEIASTGTAFKPMSESPSSKPEIGKVRDGDTTIFVGSLSDCWAYVQIKEREEKIEQYKAQLTSKDIDEFVEISEEVLLDAADGIDPEFGEGQPDPLKTPDSTEVVGPDWSQVDDEYQWWAMDENGEAWFYRSKPTLVSDGWRGVDGEGLREDWSGYHPNWRESLTKRPEVEGRKSSDAQTQAKAMDADTSSEELGLPSRPAATPMTHEEIVDALQLLRHFFEEYGHFLDERQERLDAMLAARDQGDES